MTSIVVGKDRISLVESERYVAGTKNLYLMKAAFSKDWEGIEKKLVFKTDCFEQAVELITCSEQFPIPYEVLAQPTNKLQIGAYGYKNDQLVLNTRWLSLGRVVRGTVEINCGCCPPSFPIKPSPDTYDTLRLLIDRKADRMTLEDGNVILWAGEDPLSSFELPISEGSSITSVKVPIGTIQIWSGSIEEIPESYSLCDGQNGTPDLRDSFIIGASDEIPPGDTGIFPIMNGARSLNTTKYYALAFIQKTSYTEADENSGKSAYEIAVKNGFTGTEAEWLESLNGKSAYEIALEAGFGGTEEEFANLLNSTVNLIISNKIITSVDQLPSVSGSYIFENVTFKTIMARSNALSFKRDVIYIDLAKSNQIMLSSLQGLRYSCKLNSEGKIFEISEIQNSGGSDEGAPGKDGLSAYEVAVKNGFTGTEAEWLASLKGSNGLSAYEVAVKNGFTGTEAEWLASLKGDKGDPGSGSDGTGADGKSAYEIAVENGFTGTEVEWLESLKGTTGLPGDNGLSAYEIAVDNGYDGSEVEWLASLKGPTGNQGAQGLDGKSAYQIAVDNGYVGDEETWLASLHGKSVQSLTDYKTSEVISGRWIDNRPVYRQVINVTLKSIDNLTSVMSLPEIEMVIPIRGTIEGQNGNEVCSIPGYYGDYQYGLSYNSEIGEIQLWSSLSSTSEKKLTLFIEYVKIGDDTLSDSDLILDTDISSGGTNDHSKLINRSADNQHPISSINGLSAVLDATPTKSISDAELDALFNKEGGE